MSINMNYENQKDIKNNCRIFAIAFSSMVFIFCSHFCLYSIRRLVTCNNKSKNIFNLETNRSTPQNTLCLHRYLLYNFIFSFLTFLYWKNTQNILFLCVFSITFYVFLTYTLSYFHLKIRLSLLESLSSGVLA